MTTLEVTPRVKVEVDNTGLITFIAENGLVCHIQVHPHDLELLLRFLVKQGYDFS